MAIKYSEIIKSLYGNKQDDIISILQKSVYVTSIKKDEEISFILHTGFTFFNHKNTCFAILLAFNELNDNILIIRQPVSYKKIPDINGLMLERDGDYFNKFHEFICAEVIEKSVDGLTFKKFEIDEPPAFFDLDNFTEIVLHGYDSNVKISRIKIFIENDQPFEAPLQRRFQDKIFFDGEQFKKYQPNEINRNYDFRDKWRQDTFTDDSYNQDGMRRDDDYNPENWQGHDG